jgi:tRNA dimethylallyltransferase
MDLADKLKAHRPLEIISVDSALVFRGMNIGTAKPSRQERDLVPHHLIDILEPTQAYSAARFVEDAGQLIRDIHERGHFPLIVGGTMLYVKALQDGLHDLPATNADVRAQVLAEANALGWPAMHEQLCEVDPDRAARLAPNDAQRISRALELYRQTGRSMTSWWAEANPGPAADLSFETLALEPGHRERLHERIERRFQGMMAEGFLDEMQQLRSRGDLHADHTAMRCVGYRQAWEWLDQKPQPRLNTLIERGVIATRQLAKRQLTWLRAMPERHRLDCFAPDLREQALDHVRRTLDA